MGRGAGFICVLHIALYKRLHYIKHCISSVFLIYTSMIWSLTVALVFGKDYYRQNLGH